MSRLREKHKKPALAGFQNKGLLYLLSFMSELLQL